MSRFCLNYKILFLLFLLIGCSSPQPPEIEEAVIGTWLVTIPESVESLKKLPRFKDKVLTDAEVKQLTRFAEKFILSVDTDHIGIVNGAKAERMTYRVISKDAQSMQLETEINNKKNNVSVNLDEGLLQISFGGDIDYFVWKKSENTQSALTNAYYEPPQKDANGNSPADIVEKLFILIEAGKRAEAEKHIANSFKEELNSGVTYLKSTDDLFDQMTKEGTQRYGGVTNVRYLVGEDEIWNVSFDMLRDDGKSIGDWARLKLIGNQWQLVSKI